MAQAIVNALEVIEIDKQQRELLWFASGLRQQPLELIFEIKPIRQCRECIDGRQGLELPLGSLELGNIGEDADGVDDLARLIQYVACREPER